MCWPSTVEKFCQRAVLLHKGRLHGIGEANAIIDQYHALLYSDEKAYLRYVNSEAAAAAAPLPPNVAIGTEPAGTASEGRDDCGPAQPEFAEAPGPGAATPAAAETSGQLRAYIEGWSATDDAGEPCEVFMSG